ncbi:MAG: AAA family ATPase [Chloroflexi bacterium CFX4]|nr:AAA family ATPase [Chloroflexi bacterium CFX4]
MLTKLKIRNFKRLTEAEIELGSTVVFIGPNNSGKTTALQALALWDIGLKAWLTRRRGSAAEKRSGVTINRRDLIAVPVPNTDLLWRDLDKRNVRRQNGKPITQNVRVDIIVSGESQAEVWNCGLEFDYANSESLYCRPLRLSEDRNPQRMPVPSQAAQINVAYLPPMSGLASTEAKVDSGRINVLIGEGQTAQVLRNLCHQLYENSQAAWDSITRHIQTSFGARLLPPEYIPERGEITLAYKEREGDAKLDISSSGRGLQQVLLLLAYLHTHPNSVLLLDEPDAHLEIIRQREIYNLLTETAQQHSSQVLIASHSEVMLDEAASRGIVIAFIGKQPRRINDRGSQLRKALRDIPANHYYQAERKGWVLYLEGATDLSILRSFAKRLNHPASQMLESVFVHYIDGNNPQTARDHFYGLREAYPDLAGVAIFDRLDKALPPEPLKTLMWQRREIENYVCSAATLFAYAQANPDDGDMPLFVERRLQTMRDQIDRFVQAFATQRKPSPWSPDLKATDEFLDPLFENYYEGLGLANQMRKANYHILANYVPAEEIDPEITEKLDAILETAQKAKPAEALA